MEDVDFYYCRENGVFTGTISDLRIAPRIFLASADVVSLHFLCVKGALNFLNLTINREKFWLWKR